MKPISFLLAGLLAACQILPVFGAAVDTNSLDTVALPYPLVEAVFMGENNGEKYKLNGTVNSVLAQLEAKYGDNVTAAATGNDLSARGSEPILARYKNWPPLCFYNGYRWKTTDAEWVNGLARNLKSLGGVTLVGPESCVFMGCLNDARAYLCNDRPDTITPQTAYLGGYITEICGYNPCRYYSPTYGHQCGGQLFDSDGYNVIVRRRFLDEDRC